MRDAATRGSERRVSGRLCAGGTRRWRRIAGRKGDGGFTIIELLAVTTILPIIIGSLALALLQMFKLQSSISTRLTNTEDSQIASIHYTADVEGAGSITTAPSISPECGTGTQLLGLQGNGTNTVTSYMSVKTGTTYSLVRNVCTSGGSVTPTRSTTVVTSLSSSQAPPTITYVSGAPNTSASTSWVDAQYVLNISWPIVAPENLNGSSGSYAYTLVASPAASSITSGTSGSPSTISTSSKCQSATPGTGTYASTMCLVDFSVLSTSDFAAAQNGCLDMSASLPGGYTLFFCLSITGGPVKAATLPTYPQAFLGNTSSSGVPFYSGIAGGPALYQNVEGTTTVATFNYITIVASDGSLATGWEVVSADAETTDQNESITWTTGSDPSAPNLFWIPNTSTSIVGNACGNFPPGPAPSSLGAGFWGNGTKVMECAGGNVSNPQLKTGTPMVEALTPTMLKATMVGTGLEAVAFGVMIS